MASTGDSLGALGLLGFRTSGKRSSRAAPAAPPAHPHPPALVAASSAGGASAGSTAAAPAAPAPVEARVVISVVGGPRVAAADYEPGPDESVGAKLLRAQLSAERAEAAVAQAAAVRAAEAAATERVRAQCAEELERALEAARAGGRPQAGGARGGGARADDGWSPCRRRSRKWPTICHRA